eukprot:7382052-Prymnesium_polylepis.2
MVIYATLPPYRRNWCLTSAALRCWVPIRDCLLPRARSANRERKDRTRDCLFTPVYYLYSLQLQPYTLSDDRCQVAHKSQNRITPQACTPYFRSVRLQAGSGHASRFCCAPIRPSLTLA